MKTLLSLIPFLLFLNGCQLEQEIESETVVCNKDEFLFSLPKHILDYRDSMATFSQEGGENPLNSVQFVSECIPKTSFKELAERSAKDILISNYKNSGRVTHFRIRDNVAYVELAAHTDGWPGVTASLAAVEPIIKRNLFLNSKVEDVVVGEIID
ncbi:hypothetical protein [Aliivibrio sifiae]|uniref:Lipoprotein n=1 Tax=Aliivibrio sifiae TaxID=566293 RepID=A0A2S7X4E3_9GAMM|nr:hypothetical protein [Aliivibrio sifiae]PQJ85086.1 hypothetical protein BTO22_16555 [Aliivibrio sifiae]PQJ86843.1 hypothetical protein BTO23_11960 [Aliivibrio sifiae]GLR74038.1 lipoprotein [Aliivibrio sifiae]